MNHEHNEFVAKIGFALFAVLSILFSKVHADTAAFSTQKERSIMTILERELQHEYPEIKVNHFRCDERQKKCLTILKLDKNAPNSFCELHNVDITDFKKSSFVVLDPFYFNKIKSCL